MATPGEMAERLKYYAGTTYAVQTNIAPDLETAATMILEADRIMRLAGVELASEGLGVDGLDGWLGVPEDVTLFADYRKWMLGG